MTSREVSRAGFRLTRLEIYNWGTFHERVWAVTPRGDNLLLTGDIGSGKSTLVDALTTLLVPPQKISYNKAAGAETRERSLRSYVLGFYKSERGDAGLSARPVPLRDQQSYSVLLARFANEALEQEVTLAQVFWHREKDGPPARLFVVADAPLSIAEHFTNFGPDLTGLRKRLRRIGSSEPELHDSFPPYGAAFRRRFGIENEQALELFHQTVSMKSVGNLTDFVRQHMLEPFEVEPRIQALITHFDDLSRAHDAVLKAKAQIDRLTPLVAECDQHERLTNEVADLRAGRDALHAWFTSLKSDLLEKRRVRLEEDATRQSRQVEDFKRHQKQLELERNGIQQAIADNGGARLERLRADIVQRGEEKIIRQRRAEQYAGLAATTGLPDATTLESFAANQRAIVEELDRARDEQATTQNALTEASVEFRDLKRTHDDLTAELASLRGRRSNIPSPMVRLRDNLCRDLGLDETDVPFVGEILQVHEDERDWEGAIERLLHGYGLSMLVADAHYRQVSGWVNQTHLGQRLVYFQVRELRARERPSSRPDSVARKLAIKPDSPFYQWIEQDLFRRFNHICCATQDQFHREPVGITQAGQIRNGEHHEKDDRRRIDDRSQYILGWSNEEKIAALEKDDRDQQARLQKIGLRISGRQDQLGRLQERLGHLGKLEVFQHFEDLNWRTLTAEIQDLERQCRELESASNVLQKLGEQLASAEALLKEANEALEKAQRELTQTQMKLQWTGEALHECALVLREITPEQEQKLFPRLASFRDEALGVHTLTVESCSNREHELREWLQAKINAEDKRLGRLTESIVGAMAAYRKDYPVETQEADASVAAAREFRAMLARLQSDDLPRFEKRFKELLNENTIREVAGFQSALIRERQTIRERIEIINESLKTIDYNPGRYIILEDVPTTDVEVRDFQHDLKACTEGVLSVSGDVEYTERKFVQVREIIERFRGREGTTEADRRWTRKVADVRNWFTFAASERWRADNREHEHYADSGGKSGGQKEKLAYTVLAASLAYQFGLEIGSSRPRSFRFVIIDEAFGRGSDESARYGLELFERLQLQLLIVTPLQKIHIIEPYVSGVGFVHCEEGRISMVRNLTIEEYRAEKRALHERSATGS